MSKNVEHENLRPLSAGRDIPKRLSSAAVESSAQDQQSSIHRYGSRLHPRCNIPISPYGWYRVLVFSHYSRLTVSQVLARLRLAVAPRRFRYYYLHEGGEHDVERDKRASFTFYVDNYKLAAELQLRGHCPPLVGLRVNDRPPMIRVDEAYRCKLRKVIMSRYNASKQSLNLRRFYADDFWCGEFCALQQFECLAAAIDIMEEEMPQLRRLQLDNNHLCHLGGFKGVEQRLPHLHCISLQNNDLKTLRELRMFRRLRLTDLTLRRNPLPRNYQAQLLTMFPELRSINGRPVKRDNSCTTSEITVSLIDSDSESESESASANDNDNDNDSDVEIVSITEYKPAVMPEVRVTYMAPHPLTKELAIRKYVRRYLKAFDNEKRSKYLERFYERNALVSLTLPKERTVLPSWTAPYAVYSRQLQASRGAVLEMYAAWPKTVHLPSTMTLDLTLVDPRMLCVSITGSYEENGMPHVLRHYMRTFVLTKPADRPDFRIANELIYLSSSGRKQRQPAALNPVQCNLATKLSAETRLKSRWSSKFLKETNWDYQQALLAFQTLLRRRELPEHAFVNDIKPEPSPLRQL